MSVFFMKQILFLSDHVPRRWSSHINRYLDWGFISLFSDERCRHAGSSLARGPGASGGQHDQGGVGVRLGEGGQGELETELILRTPGRDGGQQIISWETSREHWN